MELFHDGKMNRSLPFKFHLASCLVHYECVQRPCLPLVLLIMHFRSGKRMAYILSLTNFALIFTQKKKWKRIFTCSFIYSCMNISILGGEKTSQHSSVRSNNKQAFLLLRRETMSQHAHLTAQCIIQSWFFRLWIPLISCWDCKLFLLAARRKDLS